MLSVVPRVTDDPDGSFHGEDGPTPGRSLITASPAPWPTWSWEAGELAFDDHVRTRLERAALLQEIDGCAASRSVTTCRTAAGVTLQAPHKARTALAVSRAGQRWYRARPGSLTAAAQVLGTHGVLVERARVYQAEQEVFGWWREEHAWMTAPKTGVRTGPRTHDEQTALVLAELGRPPRRRYPRDQDGRADHAAARVRVIRRLATA